METIRNYLKAMFAGLPDTPEVRKAYEELAAMMEDKYTELIDEGKSENEAVGTVISEFGNRDELAQSLGIEEYINSKAAAEQCQNSEKEPDVSGEPHAETNAQQASGDTYQSFSANAQQTGGDTYQSYSANAQQTAGDAYQSYGAGPRSGGSTYRRPEQNTAFLSSDDVMEYIAAGNYSALLTAFGVFLCITAPTGAILTGDLGGGFIGDFFSSVGVALLFVFVAAAVGFFRMSGNAVKPWTFVKKQGCRISDEAWEILESEESQAIRICNTQNTLGIIMCILSIVFPIIFGGNFGAACMFVVVGAGVFLIVRGSCKKGVYKTLRQAHSKAESYNYSMDRGQPVYVSKGKEPKYYYDSKNLESLMLVYWEVVTCIYFGWSFLTGTWGISWLIWIIAGIVKKIIENRYGIPSAGR